MPSDETLENQRSINRAYAVKGITVDYPHVGLLDVETMDCWVARKRWGVSPVRVSHARMLKGGTQEASTAEKDRFLCYWYHNPGSGEGYVHGYPIDWSEAHVLVRLDPQWNHAAQAFIPATNTARIDRNVDQQYHWGQRIFQAYLAQKPEFAISWHMIGPRPVDSMFYIERHEGTKRRG